MTKKVEITQYSKTFRGKSYDYLAVTAPFNPAALADMKAIPGRRWDAERKANTFPVSQRQAVHDLLVRHYAGLPAVGPKGPFTLGGQKAAPANNATPASLENRILDMAQAGVSREEIDAMLREETDRIIDAGRPPADDEEQPDDYDAAERQALRRAEERIGA
jgi:hypothetical protein